MIRFYPNPYTLFYHMPMLHYIPDTCQHIPRQPEPQLEPYLVTWPYSNVYYGNYYES
ncbi:MAG: hypothetical protein ACE3JP_07735 [Ectobacillus sp.]